MHFTLDVRTPSNRGLNKRDTVSHVKRKPEIDIGCCWFSYSAVSSSTQDFSIFFHLLPVFLKLLVFQPHAAHLLVARWLLWIQASRLTLRQEEGRRAVPEVSLVFKQQKFSQESPANLYFYVVG